MLVKQVYSTARLNTESRYLVAYMKDTIPDEKLQKTIDILDQAVLALKFYIETKELRYSNEFKWAIKRLHQLLQEGEKHE